MSEHIHGEGCQDFLKDLSAYIDGELDRSLCIEIESHMAECENCRIVVDTLRKTVLLYRELPVEPLPRPVEERLFKRLDLVDYLPSQNRED